MSRIRSIHPGLFTDEAFVSLSPIARVFAMGLWTECDDDGIFEWSPLKLKMRILPADNADAATLLTELADNNLVEQYEVSGKKYGAVRNFCLFQRPQKPKAIHPKTDEIVDYVGITEREKRNGNKPVQDEYRTDTIIPRQMEDGGGRMETSSGKPEEVKARKRAAPAPKKPSFEVPDWIPKAEWDAFVEMRREMERGPKKIPFTVGAAKGIISELEKHRAGGHDIGAILMKSAINSYRGVFAPDGAPAAANDPHAKPMTDDDRAAYLAKLEAKPWANATTRAEQRSDRGNRTQPIGDLVQRIAGGTA